MRIRAQNTIMAAVRDVMCFFIIWLVCVSYRGKQHHPPPEIDSYFAAGDSVVWFRPFKITVAKVRLAMAAMGQPKTKVADLCRELGVTRQTLYTPMTSCAPGSLQRFHPKKPVSARYAAVTLTSSVMIRPSSQTKAIPPSSSVASGSW